MSRKIVIIPEFASSHFLKCWIPNIIESIGPDIIIINSGLFPEGPENKGHIDKTFKDKYCYKDTMVGFDIEDTEALIKEIREDHFKKTLSTSPIIYLQKNGYTLYDSNKCFLESISRCSITNFREGDLIFPLEPDAFLLESDKDIIEHEVMKLKPGMGLKCLWRDFIGNQHYCEAINEINPKIRRFCYCFDNMENYRRSMNGFMTQSYPLLDYTDKFWIRHYPWFVYGKWKELRYEMIFRVDPEYWRDFEIGLKNIDESTDKSPILMRPSRHDESRWAKYIDCEHPTAIKCHKNYKNT